VERVEIFLSLDKFGLRLAFVTPSNLRPPEKVGYEALCWKWNSDILQLLEFMIDIIIIIIIINSIQFKESHSSSCDNY
jgi:hypothetical protein